MLIRISLILAIIAGLAVGVVNFVWVKEKVTTLQTNLDTQTKRADTAESSLAKANRDLKQTQGELTQTKQSLDTAKTERDAAVTKANEQEKRATQLAEDLASTRSALDATNAFLARYTGSNLKPEEVLALSKNLIAARKEIDDVKAENKVFARKIADLQNELATYRDPTYVVPLPADLLGKVIVVDPKWDFVIINVGKDQGVLQNGELLVSRNGKLVAKVKVTDVQKDRSIANVIPGPWKLGEPMEGDEVIPAHPAS